MINVYTGVVGSGKSLHAAQDMLDALLYKEVLVITNVKISENYLMERRAKHILPVKDTPHVYIPTHELDPKEILKLSQAWYKFKPFSENGVLLVIDEAQLVFNSRTWNEAGRQDWIYLFTNSRHFGIRVILVTQMIEMIDKQIRGCIEIEYVHRNMANFGLMGKAISLLVGGKLFVVVGKYIGLQQRISVEYVLGRRRLYNFYDSYEVMKPKGGIITA